MNKTIRKLLLVLMIAMFAVSALPSAAYAGTNGQQLKIRFGSTDCVQKWAVTVKGKNQRGIYTTWTRTEVPKRVGLFSCEISTTNSWWKGSVSITAKSSVRTSYAKTVTVPTVYASNWFVVKLPK